MASLIAADRLIGLGAGVEIVEQIQRLILDGSAYAAGSLALDQ